MKTCRLLLGALAFRPMVGDLLANQTRRRMSLDQSVWILMSFCNPAHAGCPALGVLNTSNLEFRQIATAFLPHLTGITGLASSARYIYAVTQGAGSATLLMLDHADLSLVNKYDFRTGRDVHSVTT